MKTLSYIAAFVIGAVALGTAVHFTKVSKERPYILTPDLKAQVEALSNLNYIEFVDGDSIRVEAIVPINE